MAKRKTTKPRRTTRRTTAAGRKTAARRRKDSDRFVNFFVPLFLMVAIVACLGMVLFVGFRTVSASSFFDVEQIQTEGTKNVSKEKVESIVRAAIAGRGVWEADLEAIKTEIGKADYVRHVSVSRVLPNTIKVIVDERQPVALIRSGDKTYRIDRDAKMLEAVASKGPSDPPFVMIGWDDENTDKARDANQKRLAMYLNLLEEWQSFELAKRVVAVDLTNLRDVTAVINDSAEQVDLSLGGEDFGSRLKEGIKHSAGNGKKISKIILDGASPVIVYRD